MKNKRYLIKTSVLILILIAITGLTNCKSTAEGDISPFIKEGLIHKPEGISENSINEGLDIVKNTLDKTYGDIEYKGIEKMVEKEYFVYTDNKYQYSVNLDTKHLRSMFMLELPVPEEKKEINKNQAIEIAKNFIIKIFEDLFDYDVEIKVEQDSETPEREFRIFFKQKNELGVYTGYNINIEVTKYGEINFYVALEGNFEVAKQKPKISKEKAIDIAYREAKKMADEIAKLEEKSKTVKAVNEKAKAMGVEDITPPGDSGVFSDKDPKKLEKFKANLNERNKHEVTAELTVFKNILQWWIEINNVEINREWGTMGFVIHIDAINGKVLITDRTE